MKTKIVNITGYQLLDSRSNPTVAARVELEDGSYGFALAPSGASTGEYEAHELRDGDKTRYGGRGVIKAVSNINNEINKALYGFDAAKQGRIDKTLCRLDGTENKSRLGANATLAVSLAVASAAAMSHRMPLYRYIGGFSGSWIPTPMMNILNGGAHASNNIDIQEFMIVPLGVSNLQDGVRICSEVYHTLGKMLNSRSLSTGVGDEGGYAPDLPDDIAAIELILEAVKKAGYEKEIKLALDVAASEWWQGDGKYKMPKREKELDSAEMIAWYKDLIKKYPIISIEDGLGENDWAGWERMTDILTNDVALVGDDLFVTNEERLKKGFTCKAANSILIKPNQIGTLSETVNVIKLAKHHGYQIVVSHRSGETEDTSIADLAVALNATRIKTGAPARSERTAKYNRLLMIEQEVRI
ncbi:MAG: phosphopyruvate hydratase [Acutalibacteraceae bacterium]|nr:phosphopyruvate hydratase [Clostridia bacterium]MEE1278579.1 phosphopyruvate hydratase [Acutalibacteraceae bacterium]